MLASPVIAAVMVLILAIARKNLIYGRAGHEAIQFDTCSSQLSPFSRSADISRDLR